MPVIFSKDEIEKRNEKSLKFYEDSEYIFYRKKGKKKGTLDTPMDLTMIGVKGLSDVLQVTFESQVEKNAVIDHLISEIKSVSGYDTIEEK